MIFAFSESRRGFAENEPVVGGGSLGPGFEESTKL